MANYYTDNSELKFHLNPSVNGKNRSVERT